ncbi:MAG TPA: glucose-1-phosphate cytidylyltransferase [Planctomycetota bacterium]|nr:glucose-1-phosphate cytidylyltransferase [Planctomycetota bacterium]
MPVVILAGGLGTRLKEETEYRPKPMVKIGHQPILWHIMKLYSHHGFRNFIVCLGYKGEMIREYFYHYKLYTGDVLVDVNARETRTLRASPDEVDWKVILADTGKDTMTGGRVKRIQDYVGSDEFFVTYGDGVADVDIGAALAAHRRAGTIGTVTGVHPVSRFGELVTEGDLVREFQEKQVAHDYVNGGFFVFRRKFFDYLEGGDATVLEQAPLRRLAAEGQLSMYRHDGYWQCMDTFRESELLNGLWSSGKAPWKVW